MKLHLLTTLSILILTASVNAQNVNIPDANFKAYLLSNIVLNANSDSEIQVSEAAAYNNQLNCSSLNISDLTGIEAFTAMTSLHCSDNLLTSLDVSACSSLLYLYCQDNLLTSLNFSPAVRELACSNNQLSSIDLSANMDFTILFCNNNLLTSLNVANGNNQLVNPNGFNTTGNPNLTCIEVDDAYFSLANWWYIDSWTSYSIDCSSGIGCTVTIPDANFKNYLVGNSAINTNADAEIQCSEATSFTGTINVFNMNIADLKGIESFTALTQLNCTENDLTSLDVSKNTALTFLSCATNQLTSLNVSNNTSLTNLLCSFNGITSLDVSNNVSLDLLWCNVNQLSSMDVSMLPALTSFQVGVNLISTLDISGNPNINSFTCNENNLTSLNVANGNNTNFTTFNSVTNPSLTCIQVDDSLYSAINWTNIDVTANFSENCGALSADNNNSIVETVSIFPNPANDIINIESDNEIESVTIFNLVGSLVRSESANSFSIANLPAGIYTIRVKTEKGLSINKFTKL